jgi:hypothetical protein
MTGQADILRSIRREDFFLVEMILRRAGLGSMRLLEQSPIWIRGWLTDAQVSRLTQEGVKIG